MQTLPRDTDAHAYLLTQGIRITAAERRLGVETTSFVYKVRHFVCRQLFCLSSHKRTRVVKRSHTHPNTQEAVEYAEHDERERLKIIARNNLESDCLYFGRILREETEAGRGGDVEGKSQLENVSLFR